MTTIVPFPKPTLAQKILAAFVRMKAPGVGKNLASVVAWLNAEPGRKRGVAAILLGAAAALRALGHSSLADTLIYANDFVQNYVVPGMDILGAALAFIGWLHAHQEKRA